MKNQYVELLPIPTMPHLKRFELEDLARAAQESAKQRFELQRALRRRIPDLCPINRECKLTNRLRDWWTLSDFKAFRTEVIKVFKADIPLADRSSWEDWITRDRAEIARLSGEIMKAEAEIDRIVYELFDLTSDEIVLLESTVAP